MNNIVKDISGQIDIEVVTTVEQLNAMIAELRESDVISVDTETTSLDPTKAKIVGLPIAISKDRAWYVPIGHRPHPVLDLFAGEPRFPLDQQLDLRLVRESLQPIMASKLLVMHNAKYDYLVLKSNGFTFPDGFHLLHDTMIGVRMIDQNIPASLKWLTEHFLRRKVTRYNELPHSIAESTIEDAARYGGADPSNTWALYKQQASLFPVTVAKVFYEIEMPLVSKLADMEEFGILVDRVKVEPLRIVCMDEIKKAQFEAQELAVKLLTLVFPGQEDAQQYKLNIASPAKLSAFLTMIGIPIPDEFAPDFDDPDAAISTSKKVLQTVRARLFDSEEPKDILICKLIDAIMRYREHDKVRSTYIDSLLAGHMRNHKEAEDGEAVDSMGGGRLHTSYRQIGAKSGRFSSRPNLQNLPRNKKLDIRGVLIPDAGMIFCKADWNAIELRLGASISKDETMLELMNSNKDSHAYTAAMIHGMPYDDFLGEWNKPLLESWDKLDEGERDTKLFKLAKKRNQQRDDAKTTSFLMLYQGGARTLALNLTMSTGRIYSVQTCQNIIDEWFKIYKGIKSWIETTREDIAFKGYAETIFGRRLVVGQNPSEDQLRTGVNMIIQGCLHGDTRILTQEDGYAKISMLAGKHVTVWDGKEFVQAEVMSSGRKELVHITFQGGIGIDCSPTHRFKCINSRGAIAWKRPQEIKAQDRVVCSDEVRAWSAPLNVPNAIKGASHNSNNCTVASISNYRSMGHWLGRVASDGSVCKDKAVRLYIAEHEKAILPYLKDITDQIGRCSISVGTGGKGTQPLYQIDISSKSLANQLISCRIKERIPEFVWRNKELLAGYISGMYDGDGTVSGNVIALCFGQIAKHKEWALDIQQALSLFGIRSRLNFCADRINVVVAKRDSKQFAERIGFINQVKQQKAIGLCCSYPHHMDGEIYGRAIRITSIEPATTEVAMYDVVNSESHQFMANGVVTHNSAVDILKQSLLRTDKIWTQSVYPIRTVHHIHDEIIAQTKDEPACIKAAMEGLNEAMYWHLGNVELTREIVTVRSFSKAEAPIAKF